MIKKIILLIKRYINNYKIKKNQNTIIKTLSIGKNLKIGKNCIIAKRVKIEENVTIGDCTYISSDTTIDSNVHIGKYCSIARNVFIAPGVHKSNYVTTHPVLFNPYWRSKIGIKENDRYDTTIGKSDTHTYIGNDVWIALDAIIMRGVTIGDGAIIGAGAIVTKDVEPYSVVVGNPAKHIKYRFDEQKIKKLKDIEIKWWDFSKEELEKSLIHMYDINEYLKYHDK